MAFEIKQSLRLSQQLVMTPQLQQAIKLLQLTRMELQEVVTQEMMENPILEELTEATETTSLTASDDGRDPEAEQQRDEDAFLKPKSTEEPLSNPQDDLNWENYIEEFNSSPSSSAPMREVNEELPSFENVLTKTTSLEEHLHWQLSMITLTPAEKNLGELIIGNLSEDGYLKANLAELAQEVQLELEDAQELLKIIHHFDPLGVASQNLQECLLIQARLLIPRQPLVEQMLDSHLPELEKKNYAAIAKALAVPLEKIIQATRVILDFEPKPGHLFNTGDTQYITPDIYVYKVAEEFIIVLNDDGMPKLRISPYYKNILAGMQKNQNKITKEYMQEKLRSAVWLIRSIHNRQKTIHKVTEAIVKRQHDFFEKGVQFLKPLVLREVAQDIGMHESTISRVTTNKFVHTPMGIFELKYFFNSSIHTADGSESLGSEAVKEKIKHLIQRENPRNPLSDQKLVELLRSSNIDIARRTVAKYRDVLGVLSSDKRKKVL